MPATRATSSVKLLGVKLDSITRTYMGKTSTISWIPASSYQHSARSSRMAIRFSHFNSNRLNHGAKVSHKQFKTTRKKTTVIPRCHFPETALSRPISQWGQPEIPSTIFAENKTALSMPGTQRGLVPEIPTWRVESAPVNVQFESQFEFPDPAEHYEE